MSTQSLVTVILTKNEAIHITECIVSVQPWVDRVVVWDSHSDDDTVSLALAAGAIVHQRAFDNFAAQRQAAITGVEAEWILFVDADERVTAELGQEVHEVIAQGTANGYWIPRRNFIVGDELRYGGYYPDYQLRLLRRSAAQYDPTREVHETVDVGGAEGWLQAPFIHYNYGSWAQFHHKQRVYARYEARILAGRGIRPRPHNFMLQPLREWWRRFVNLQGWRDGWPGLRLALLLAWYYGVVPYWILWREGVEFIQRPLLTSPKGEEPFPPLGEG